MAMDTAVERFGATANCRDVDTSAGAGHVKCTGLLVRILGSHGNFVLLASEAAGSKTTMPSNAHEIGN